MRFSERESHHLFLEPEGRRTREIYVNGLSTSLPVAVQAEVLAAIPRSARARAALGLCRRVRRDRARSDRSRAGVPRGGGVTSLARSTAPRGYEEAAAQGLVAGQRRACSRGASRWRSRAPTATPACSSMTWCGACPRSLPHVHQPRRAPPAPARQCRPSAHAAGWARGPGDRRARAGGRHLGEASIQAARARVSRRSHAPGRWRGPRSGGGGAPGACAGDAPPAIAERAGSSFATPPTSSARARVSSAVSACATWRCQRISTTGPSPACPTKGACD